MLDQMVLGHQVYNLRPRLCHRFLQILVGRLLRNVKCQVVDVATQEKMPFHAMVPGGGGAFDLDAWIAADHCVTNVPTTPPAPPSYPPPPDVYMAVGRGGGTGAPGGPVGSNQLILREGDWTCYSCRNVNFAKRTRCNKCGAPRPKKEALTGGSGNPLDEVPHFSGPPGLFKRGDWPCTHCGNVNWARRDKCNVCNAPKPSTVEAPRTGRAGGHYDLQDPHDRQQHLSDEEYDEFGRRKKPNRSSAHAASGVQQASGAQIHKKSSSQQNLSEKSGSQAVNREGASTKLIPLQSSTHSLSAGSGVQMGNGTMQRTTTASVPDGSTVEGPSAQNPSQPLKLHFPSPPLCYLKGRTMSMSSTSSHTSDYTISERSPPLLVDDDANENSEATSYNVQKSSEDENDEIDAKNLSAFPHQEGRQDSGNDNVSEETPPRRLRNGNSRYRASSPDAGRKPLSPRQSDVHSITARGT